MQLKTYALSQPQISIIIFLIIAIPIVHPIKNKKNRERISI